MISKIKRMDDALNRKWEKIDRFITDFLNAIFYVVMKVVFIILVLAFALLAILLIFLGIKSIPLLAWQITLGVIIGGIVLKLFS